jgi:hypothetical protein
MLLLSTMAGKKFELSLKHVPLFRKRICYRMVFLLFVFQVCLVICENSNVQQNEAQLFVKCLIQICNDYFDHQIVISVPPYHGKNYTRGVSSDSHKFYVKDANDFERLLLQELFNSGRWSLFVYINTGETGIKRETSETCCKPCSYIFYLQNNVTRDLNDMLELLKTLYFRNFKSRFVVVLDKTVNETDKTISKVLSKLWEFRIINAVVLFKGKAHDILDMGSVSKVVEKTSDVGRSGHVIGVYTWFPYRDSENCYDTSQVYLLDIWVMKGNGQFIQNNFLFPNKVKNNLNNCEITVSTTENLPYVGSPDYTNSSVSQKNVYNKGWDIALLNIVKKAVNVSVRFRPPSREKQGRLLTNGTFTGIIGDLTYGLADLALAGMPLIIPFTDRGDYTVIYSGSEYIWLVPCARSLVGWTNVFKIFSSNLWICVFLSVFVAAGAMFCLAKCKLFRWAPKIVRYSNFVNSSCNICAVFVGTAAPTLPRISTLRIFFLAWICYCLAVNTVVQSYFISFLVKPNMEKQVSSLDEILDSGMEYGFTPYFDVIFRVKESPLYSNILSNRKSCNCERCCLQRLAYERDFAMLFRMVKYENAVKYEYVDRENSRSVICRAPEPFLVFYNCMYTPKGHHLRDRLNVVISRIFQAGFYKQLQNSDLHLLKLRLRVNDKAALDDEYYDISLKHLQVVFYIFLVGQGISLLVLLLEILCSNWKYFIRTDDFRCSEMFS